MNDKVTLNISTFHCDGFLWKAICRAGVLSGMSALEGAIDKSTGRWALNNWLSIWKKD